MGTAHHGGTAARFVQKTVGSAHPAIMSTASVRQTSHRSQHTAAALLVLACLFWGLSFVWAKNVGEAMNEISGAGQGGLFGPVGGLTLRFLLSSILWFAFVPAARRGWTWRTVRRGAVVGGFLAAAIVMQHLGLDRTSEAVAAFLTSLTVVFVPVLALVVYRRRLGAIIWAGVVTATVGVWMMTGATPTGFGVGEALGLTCSVFWAFYILAIDRYGTTEHPARLVAASFVINALVLGVAAMALAPTTTPNFGNESPHLQQPNGSIVSVFPMLFAAAHDPRVWQNTVLLSVLATVASFGILTYQQPKIDPTRASLIYLSEPIFASAFAWAWAGSAMGGVQIVGAGLILTANVVVEVLSSRAKPVAPGDGGPAA